MFICFINKTAFKAKKNKIANIFAINKSVIY